MALTVGELVGYLRVNRDDWRRGLRESRDDMRGFQRDANGRLHDVRGRFVKEGHGAGEGFARGIAAGVGKVVRSLGLVTAGAIAVGGKVGGATLAIAALVGVAVQAAGAVAALGGALVTASGALLIIPGAALAGAGALATLQLGLSGVGEALSNIDDPAAFAEALKDLAPSARAFATAVRDLAPEFDKLKLSVQQELFRGLGAEVKRLAGEYLPVLAAQLPGIAAQFADAALSVGEFLRSAGAVRDVGTILESTRAVAGNLGSALAPIAQALLDIGTVGAQMLPGLTDGIGAAAQGFADFIRNARETGQLEEWISTGIEVLGQLGQVIGNLGSIVASVFGATNAAGAGALDVLESLTGGLADFLNSAQGTQMLADIFGAVHSVLEGLSPLFAEIGSVIADVVAPALADLGPVIGDAFKALIPAIKPLGEALAALAPVIGIIAQQFATVLAAAIQAVSPVIVALAPVLAQVAETLGGVLVTAIEAVAPYLPTLASAIGDLVVAVLPLIASLAEQLAPVLGEVLEAIIPIIPTLVDELIPAIKEQSGHFLELVAAVLPLLPALAELVAAILPLIVLFLKWQMQISSGVAPVLIFLVDVIVTVITWLVDKLAGAIRWVTRRFGEFVDFMKSGGKAFSRAIGDAVDAIVGFFRRMGDRAGDAVGSLISTVRGIPGRVKSALGNLGRLLWNAGKNLIQGLIDGIKSMLNNLGNVMGDVAGTVRDYWPFSPAKRGPLKSHPMDKAGRNIAAMLADGMTSGQGLVTQAVAGLAGRVALPTVAAAGVSPYAATAQRLAVPTTADQAARGRDGALVHIEHFHAEDGQSPYEIGHELDWASRGRGG